MRNMPILILVLYSGICVRITNLMIGDFDNFIGMKDVEHTMHHEAWFNRLQQTLDDATSNDTAKVPAFRHCSIQIAIHPVVICD